ncbi:MAG: hypothetical protein ACLSDJ_07360 [Butyricimonas faecihominis]
MSEINEEEVQNNSENKNIKQQPQVVPVIDHRLLAGKLTVYNWMEDTRKDALLLKSWKSGLKIQGKVFI